MSFGSFWESSAGSQKQSELKFSITLCQAVYSRPMKSVSLSLLSWVLALLLCSCASSKTLPALMVQRLAWMDEVAEAKRAKGLPITDPVREAGLLRTMTQRGVAAGVQAERVRSFFTGQMQAAKVRQEEWLREHPSSTTTRKVPDLTGTVRPALDKISAQMIDQLALETRIMSSPTVTLTLSDAQDRLTRAGYSAAVIEPALKGLQQALKIVAPHASVPLKNGSAAPPKNSFPFFFPALAGEKHAPERGGH